MVLKKYLIFYVLFVQCLLLSCQNNENEDFEDNLYIKNKSLPVWIVTVSGWGDPDMDNAFQRIDAYKQVADKWKLNIEFSSQLGTLTSYKYAPLIDKEINEHNERTSIEYEQVFGKDWQQRFLKEVNAILIDAD